MEVETETETSTVAGDLITALEQATLMAKQLPTATTDSSHLLQILTTLHSAHHHLSLFLSHHPPPPPPLPENSVSSAVGGGGEENDETGGAEPMSIGDDENEQNSSAAVEKVVGRMRYCFIRNKRRKRQLSPSAAAELRRSYENEAERNDAVVGPVAEFDKLRSLDLIYQFHA